MIAPDESLGGGSPTPFRYRVTVIPIAPLADGGDAGRCTIEDVTTPRDGETPDECVRREALESGWRILELRILQ